MVTFIQAIILSIVQGITEWFAISSSGHIAIFENLFYIHDLGFVVYLHFASVLGVVILFWKDIVNLFVEKKWSYIFKIIIAVIPVAIVGFLVKEQVEKAFSNLIFVGIFYIISGFFIYSTKYARQIKRHPSISDSIFIGVSQVLALFPGISRSGMATGSGLILGLKKEEAIKFSFLLAIPIVFGASLLESSEITHLTLGFPALLTSFTLTLLTSLLTIKLLIRIIKSDKFYLFGIYNFILGVILIVWGLTGGFY